MSVAERHSASASAASPARRGGALGPRLVHWAKVIWCRVGESNSTGLAAQMAFWLFLSLIPLAAVGGLVLARIAFAHGDLMSEVLGSTPPAVRDLIATQLGQVARWNGGEVGPLAAIVFVWLASSGIHSIFDALEIQEGAARPWWKKRALALATCVAFSVGLAALALLRTGLGWLFRVSGSELPASLMVWDTSWVASVLRFVFGSLIAFGLITGLYVVGAPRVRRRRRTIVPGALLAMAIQGASGFAYGLYIRVVGTGNAYQAGLGIIGVTMISLYLFCVALLVGAELNQAIGDHRAAERTMQRPMT